MIKIENVEIYGWKAAIRGMRNSLNSWDKSDSEFNVDWIDDSVYPHISGHDAVIVGSNDLELMKKLVKFGSDHSKFMRMINVTLDITAPLYWWKEWDTYHVGTVRNSCSTMHKIHEKEFTIDDFSFEYVLKTAGKSYINELIEELNEVREAYNHFDELKSDENWIGVTTKKDLWHTLIQLLPSSYNQRATVQLNYAVLRNMYHSRKNHKLDEWVEFCEWIETLPYSELITEG